MPSNAPPFLLVGVTGGIGSGKSTVCQCFERLGRLVVNADLVARQLTESDPAVRASIREEFGERVFRPDGSLDRAGLARIAFANRERTERLNAIVHPRVFEEIDALLAGTPPSTRAPYVIIEAALIFESGMDDRLHRVVVVDAPEDVRIRRVMERDGCSRDDVFRRIAAQMPVQEKVRRADFVLVNDQNAVALEKKVAFIDMLLRALPAEDLPDEA